jgi:catechol 2,3-dioxygenase-like lactoylglutathione lyase family enzyme
MQLRVARPTDRLDAVVAFYKDAVGLEVLGGFTDHDGFDGVMLGKPGASWHLELTRERGAVAGNAPSREHLLVLYIPDEREWNIAVERMRAAGVAPTPAHNPYWDRCGITYVDPDGYGVVLSRESWP